MENPNLVIKFSVERGPELFTITVPFDMAGRFLEDTGRHLINLALSSMPRKAAPATAQKEKED